MSSMECGREWNMGMAVVLQFLCSDTGRKKDGFLISSTKATPAPAPIAISWELILCPLNSWHLKSAHVLWTKILTVQEVSMSPKVQNK